MPIEFPCPQCGRTLRTPDGSEGKKAKCPSCETVSEIPAAAPPAAGGSNPFEDAGGGGFGDSGEAAAGNPFGESAAPAGGMADPTNPYASPYATSDTSATASGGKLRRSPIDFGEVMSVSWNIFNRNMGNLVLLALLLIVIVIISYFVFLAAVVVGAMIGAAANDPTVSIVGASVLGLIFGIALLFAGGWIGAGVTKYTVDMCRGRPVSFNDIFGGQQYMLRVTGYLFITQVVLAQGFTFLGMVPGLVMEEQVVQLAGQYIGQIIAAIINAFLLPLSAYFIVDRNSGLFESFQQSTQFLTGSRLMLFALYLVIGMAGGLFVVFTCGIGALFYIPFYMIFMSVVYLMCTGQAVQR